MSSRRKPQVEPQEGFGRAIRAIRAEQDVSQEALADRCEMSRAQLSKIERGLADLRLTSIFRLAQALEVSPAELLQRAEDILSTSNKKKATS